MVTSPNYSIVVVYDSGDTLNIAVLCSSLKDAEKFVEQNKLMENMTNITFNKLGETIQYHH